MCALIFRLSQDTKRLRVLLWHKKALMNVLQKTPVLDGCSWPRVRTGPVDLPQLISLPLSTRLTELRHRSLALQYRIFSPCILLLLSLIVGPISQFPDVACLNSRTSGSNERRDVPCLPPLGGRSLCLCTVPHHLRIL